MVKVIQNSFLGGQLDFEMMGRQDYAKYRKGASKLVNFNLLKRGGITKRQGFDVLLDSNGQSVIAALGIPNASKIRLVPFAYKKDHGFVLLFAGSCTYTSGESTVTYAGGCWAIFTMKGCQYRAWSIPAPTGTGLGMFTNSQIGEFDYSQCGYKLFIAHQEHAPTEIVTSEADINEAISGGASAESPFTWKRFVINGQLDDAIPSIYGAYQERVAPTEDTKGAKYTEKYKASSVFDGNETKPCDEFYGTGFVEVNVISGGNGSVVNGVLTGVSISATDGYKSSTSGTSSASGTTTYTSSTTTTPSVSNTGKTYTNRKYGSCNGTTYYLPWTESQTIELTITAPKNGTVYPDHINIYKRSSSYYGLVGTVLKTEGSIEDDLANTTLITGATTSNSDNLTNSTKEERGADAETEVGVTKEQSDNHGDGRTGYSITNAGSIRVTFSSDVTKESEAEIGLYLGKAVLEFKTWATYTEESESGTTTKNDYTQPRSADFRETASDATTLNITANCTYTKVVEGQETRVTENITGTVTIPAVSATTTTYPASGTLTPTKFKANYQTQYNNWLKKIGTTNTSFKLSDVIDDPAGLTGSLKFNYITLAPASGTLTVNGLSVYGITSKTYKFVDRNITPDNSITPISDEWEAPFKSSGNYPASVAVYQQRLVWASSKNDPETVWMSAVGDFYDYSEHEIQNDDDAIEFSMPVTRFAKLNHIVEMKRLIAFNSACEWLIDSSSSQKGITYETIRAMPQSYSGSNARMKPLICNNSLVFVERTGQAVRRFAYNIQDDGFAGRDISILSNSIFEHNSIIDWTYQQNPFNMVWCVLSDGTLASLTLMEEQDIIAWATHKHGDPNARFTAIATSFAVSPSLADIESNTDEPYELSTTDEVFAIVEHTDPTTSEVTRTLERMRVRSEANDSIYNSVCMDSVRIANNSTTLSSGEIGVNPTTGAVTTSGSVPANTIIGYPFESRFVSVYPSMNEQYVGGGQFAIKNLTNLNVRLEASSGGKVAAARSDGTAMPIRYDDDRENDCSPVFSNGVATFKNCDAANCRPLGCNNRDGRVTITQDEPWPFTLLSYEAEYATENERYKRTL